MGLVGGGVHGMSLSRGSGRCTAVASLPVWPSASPTVRTSWQRTVDDSVDRGYRRVKIKVAPGRDVDVLRFLRERFPDVDLAVDANGSYALSDVDTLRGLTNFS